MENDVEYPVVLGGKVLDLTCKRDGVVEKIARRNSNSLYTAYAFIQYRQWNWGSAWVNLEKCIPIVEAKHECLCPLRPFEVTE